MDKIDIYLIEHEEKFTSHALVCMQEKLRGMSSDQFRSIRRVSFRKPAIILVLSILGIERFFLGQPGLAILKLILIPLLVGVIWWISDICTATRRTKEYNSKLFMQRYYRLVLCT